METVETLVLDDELREELLALTEGEAAPCFQCGVWGYSSNQTAIDNTI